MTTTQPFGTPAWLQEQVHISAALSCGCSQRKSPPVPMPEAAVWPGTVVICDRHDEFAVVLRVSTYLADPHGAIKRLLTYADLGLSADDIEAIACEQAP